MVGGVTSFTLRADAEPLRDLKALLTFFERASSARCVAVSTFFLPFLFLEFLCFFFPAFLFSASDVHESSLSASLSCGEGEESELLSDASLETVSDARSSGS